MLGAMKNSLWLSRRRYLQEYTRVATLLNHKYPLIDISNIIELITIYSELYSPVAIPSVSRDHDDDKFIACALAANARFIITGDRDLLDVNGYAGLEIITPRKFLDNHI
jgi:putative PIN family toxin of toxin-antitoxin system